MNSMSEEDVQLAQQMIADAANRIVIEMEKALIAGHEKGMDFATLAEKNLDENLMEKLATMGQHLILVYRKLFLAAHEHIQKNSEPLLVAFAMIEKQSKDEHAIGKFLGSFVIPHAEKMVMKLHDDHPNILENNEFWS